MRELYQMKKYMVITLIEGKQSAMFFDDYDKASQYKMDAECGIGAIAEVYVYQEETENTCGGYEFLYS